MTTHASQTDETTGEGRAAQAGSTIGSTTGSTSGQAAQVAGSAKEQAAGVAGTAKEQALDVAHDAAGQARNLLDELRQNVRDQVGSQRSSLARTLDGYAGELHRMAGSSQDDGPATEAVRQVAARLTDLKGYLESDGDVVGDVRRFARRRPGTFLLACAAAGVLAGRATRGAAAARRQEQGGRHVVDVREPEDPSQYLTGEQYRAGEPGVTRYRGGEARDGGYGPEYGTGVPIEPVMGVERTSDPNLRPTSGPLAGDAPTGDPVPPDLGPGPTGLDEEISRAGQARTATWDRGER